MKPLSVVSLFSGLGGLDLGFQMQGFQTVWANDISTNAIASYKLNFGIPGSSEDIAKISPRDIPMADVIIGGPPCQSFSLVGKRIKEDPRGKLVDAFVRVVTAHQPKGFVMENVPGMAASFVNGERLPRVLSEKFERLGYFVTEMRLVATDYLVPQRRKRLFLVGCTAGHVDLPDPDTFALECMHVERETFDISAKAAIGDLGLCTKKGERSSYNNVEPSAFAKWMRTDTATSVSLHECPRLSDTDKAIVAHIPPGGNYLDIPNEIAPKRALKFKESGGRTTTYGRLHPDRPSYTINTYFRRPNVGCNFHYGEDRLITPREAMRFQAFPDHFEIAYSSQDERNALIGNAVPSLMARAVAWALKAAMSGRSISGRRHDRTVLF